MKNPAARKAATSFQLLAASEINTKMQTTKDTKENLSKTTQNQTF